jgi:drug/metabolite transporter (DMT)-like permease
MLQFVFVLSIIFTTLFAACYKVAAEKKCNLEAVNLWMYAGGTLTILIYILLRGHYTFNAAAAIVGAIAGLISYYNTLTFFLHIRSGQLSTSWTVISLSLSFPVLASIFVWHEQPSARQTVGLLLIVIAISLFGRREIKNERNRG